MDVLGGVSDHHWPERVPKAFPTTPHEVSCVPGGWEEVFLNDGGSHQDFWHPRSPIPGAPRVVMVTASRQGSALGIWFPHLLITGYFSKFLLSVPIPVPISGLIFNFQSDLIRRDFRFSSRSISLTTNGISVRPSPVLRREGAC